MGKLVKRIRRADGSRARCCASARLRQSPPLASYSQTFSEPMFGVAAMDHTSSDLGVTYRFDWLTAGGAQAARAGQQLQLR